MQWSGWIVASTALFVAAWLVFDGAHALVTGDYVTPKRGRFAGQLGPWAKLVAALGVEPRSTTMKVFHVAFGAVWIVAIAGYIAGSSWAWGAMLAFAVLSMWYFPFGTLLGLVQLALLLLGP